MNKKGKGKGIEKFKPTPKVTNDDQIIQELQVKKAYLIEKLKESNEIQNQSKAKLLEVQQRLNDIRNIHDKEKERYSAVASDYKNQKHLVELNFKEKLQFLEQEKTNREEKIKELKEKKDSIIDNHKKEIKKKDGMLAMIKTNMDDLSKFFSDQLGEIQKSLQDQIKEISKNWDVNISEHLKAYEEGIKKFDIGKSIG